MYTGSNPVVASIPPEHEWALSGHGARRGYPDGLRRERIPLEARIVRIADAFDGITSNRPYHSAWSVAWALAHLQRQAGRQFDPELVALFIQLAESGRLPLRTDTRAAA